MALVAGITIVGTVIGVICGYVGGWIDSLIMRISDIFLAFPEMVFAIAIAGVLNGGIWVRQLQ
ncbi:MAG: ABC transporter permease subunit [Eubacteriales bacterium]